MEIEISLPGGARVDAHVYGHTIATDQPPMGGGAGSAPTPFVHFLASIGTCAGIYVLGFCRNRGISTEGVRLLQTVHKDSGSGMVDRIEVQIQVLDGFPQKYLPALERAVNGCAVKQHLERPPQISVQATMGVGSAA